MGKTGQRYSGFSAFIRWPAVTALAAWYGLRVATEDDAAAGIGAAKISR